MGVGDGECVKDVQDVRALRKQSRGVGGGETPAQGTRVSVSVFLLLFLCVNLGKSLNLSCMGSFHEGIEFFF